VMSFGWELTPTRYKHDTFIKSIQIFPHLSTTAKSVVFGTKSNRNKMYATKMKKQYSTARQLFVYPSI